MVFFFFKQKTAYEQRISDWSSDVCSSDLPSEIGFWIAGERKVLSTATAAPASFAKPESTEMSTTRISGLLGVSISTSAGTSSRAALIASLSDSSTQRQQQWLRPERALYSRIVTPKQSFCASSRR